MEYLKKDIWIGLFVIGAILVIIFTLVFYKGLNPYSRKVYVMVESVTSLNKGIKVMYKGYEVGLLQNITFQPNQSVTGQETDQFQLELVLKQDFKIYEGTRFEVKGLGLMGTSYINVVLPEQRTNELKGKVVFPCAKGAGGGIDIGLLFENVNKATKSVVDADLAGKLNNVVDRFNKMSTIAENLAKQLQVILANVNGTVKKSSVQVDVILGKTSSSIDSLNLIMSQVRGMIGNDDQGVVKIIHSMDQSMERLKNIAQGVDTLTAKHQQDLENIIVNLKDAAVSLNYVSKHPMKTMFGGKVKGLKDVEAEKAKADSLQNIKK
jgi:ABC-type transporter Mla subunit MlaD